MILGITSLSHDASVSVVEGNEILFAGHAERYSRIKNDGNLNQALLEDALKGEKPKQIVWYENPIWKRARYVSAGQWSNVFKTPMVKTHLADFGLRGIPVSFVSHHESHAAAGYFTSPFSDAAILVCDAIGEFETISIWKGQGSKLESVWSQSYPHSLGLLYSAFTQRIGFKPNEEEYIMMGMAALGKPIYEDIIRQDFLDSPTPEQQIRLRHNVHRGIRKWRPEITDIENIAASVQKITQDELVRLARFAQQKTHMANLVFMGGVALNCVANTAIADSGVFGDMWIMPNPGDAGSSLGAIAAHMRRHLNWRTPYLGYDIARAFDEASALQALLDGKVIGVANGRAEFGPRAFGNRSLIADPRGPNMKDRVNEIKKREPFRPFAPIVMAHHADEHFEMPVPTSPYMQFVARVRRPDLFPAITHYDGTARVQTLTEEQNPVFYSLLRKWYRETGCPMLLNTSLNIKGEPLVNTWDDALRFSERYRVPVY